MKPIDRFKTISKEFDADLKAVLAKHGYAMEPRRIVFDRDAATAHLKLVLIDTLYRTENGELPDPARQHFKTYYTLYDLKLEWLDMKVNFEGKIYTVVGLNPRKPKNCVVLRNDATGNLANCSTQSLKYRLAQKARV